MAKTELIRYHGTTRRLSKQLYGSSTPGKEKGENCKATSLDKALAKYPRAIKTMPDEYIGFNVKKDKAAKRHNTFFTPLFTKKAF
jgi:hypothetical protein